MINKKIDKIKRKIKVKSEKLNVKIEKHEKKILSLKNDEYSIKKQEKENYKKLKKEKLQKLNEPPKLSTLEEIGNSISHGLGALLAIVAFVLLILKSDSNEKIISTFIYSFSIFIMMLSSCLYHSFKAKSKVKRLFRRFDYSSIYLLIGGTFAPFFLVYLNNTLGIVLFIVQWLIIITGITLMCVFGPGRLKWLHYPMYFIIGWSGIIFIPDWIVNQLKLLLFILIGGIIYTLGMIPFAKKGIKGTHFIWHFFALFGCIIHFIGIYLFIY